ncbi:MAG TPA: hypothetical protein DDZ51_26610 [Planctomycetaceae bacterium]|nr:hypothetical protein [Planctomycetaceae bacterium]
MTSERPEKWLAESSAALLRRASGEALRLAFAGLAFFVSCELAPVAFAVDQPEIAAGAATMQTGNDLTPGALAQIGDEVKRRLSSGTFDQRQQAMFEMWRTRLASRQAIAAATADSDPEVSTRAQWILDRWRRGILPDTPVDLARQLESLSLSESLQRLLDKGMFEGALVAIDEAKRTGDQATLTRVASSLQRGFPFYIRLANEADQIELFADLIDRMAITSDLIVSRNQLWAMIGKGDVSNVIGPTQGDGAGQGDVTGQGLDARIDNQRLKVIALAVANRLDDATAVAVKAEDQELLRVCHLLQGDWAELAKTQAELARGVAASSDEADRHWAYVLVSASRSGDDALRSEAIKNLSFRESDADRDSREDAYIRLRWQVLAMHGEIDAAVAIVKPSQPLIAAELLSQSGRLTEAFAIAGVKPDQLDQSIAPLVEQAHLAAQTWSTPQLDNAPEPLQRLVAVARLLYQCGRRDLALELYSRGAALPSSEAYAEWPIARAYILQSILRINRPDWLAKVLNQGPESAITGTGRSYFAHVFEVETETVDSLTMGLGFILKLNDKSLADAVFDFLSGEVPERFNPKTDYQRLFDTLSGHAPVQRQSTLDQRFRNRMPQRITLDFIKIFESHGQFDLAVRAMLENISIGNNEALLTYAETELKAGRPASAREIFASVWRRLEEARQSPSRLNRAEEDLNLAMRAILGEAVSAGRMGDGEEADSLWRLIDRMTCTPSAKMRNAFGETLMDQGFDERAEAIYRTLMPWVAFGSDEGVQFQAVARNFSRALGQRHEKLASEVFDLAIAGTIESTFFYPAGYVLFPTLVHRMKVNAAIAQGDQEEINRQIEALLRLSPMDIDFGENAIKKMRAAGMDDLAQQTITRIYDAGSKYMQQFPLDIVTGNNLAWVMALSDHRLEEALALSKQTVYFAPDSTVYRDTLAEILFRLDRVDDAIAIEQACLLDEPGEWHVHEQLQRFRGETAK